MKKQRVMFICIHNSGRSQIGEAVLRHLAGDRFEVQSAGIESGRLNPLVVRAVEELGISTEGQFAKILSIEARFSTMSLPSATRRMPSAARCSPASTSGFTGVFRIPQP